MARLLTVGFELRSTLATVASGVEMDNSSATASETISTSIVHGGTASLRMNPSAGGWSMAQWTLKTVATSDRHYARFYVYIAAYPSNISGPVYPTGEISFCNLINNTPATSIAVTMDGSGALRMYTGTNVTTPIFTSGALATGQWHLIEIGHEITSRYLEMKVNGTSLGTSTDTGSIAFTKFSIGLAMGGTEACAGDIYIDDVAVNDTTGSYQTGFPGPGMCKALRPNAAGDSAGWARAGTDSGANWSQVNNVPINDVTSYVQVSTASAIDMYNVDACGLAASDTINLVAVGARFNRSQSTSPAVTFRLMKTSGGTVQSSSAITPAATGWVTNTNAAPRLAPITAYVDPDGGAWTTTTLDSMQIGMIESADTTRFVQVSEIWAYVDYTPVQFTTQTKTVTAKADIRKFNDTKTVTAKARIQIGNITKSISALAKVEYPPRTFTVSAKAKILKLTLIGNSLIKTFTVTGGGTFTNTATAKASVKQLNVTRTATAKAFIQYSRTKTITAKASIVTSVVSAVKQFAEDHKTQISQGGTTTDGNTTSLKLDLDVYSDFPTAIVTPKVEVRPVGQAFTGEATHTGRPVIMKPESPTDYDGPSTVYDSVNKRMIAFGGYTSALAHSNEVWELSLEAQFSPNPQWKKITPTGTPPSARSYHGAIYDAVNERMIIFGGHNGSAALNETWELSLTPGSEAWTQLSPSGSIPAIRFHIDQQFANDVANSKAYLFGGYSGSAAKNDVYELDYSTATPTWTQKRSNGQGGNPSIRYNCVVVWDINNSRMIIQGGRNGTSTFYSDTYAYDPVGNSFTTLSPSGSAPTKCGHVGIFDPENRRMLIYGGKTADADTTITSTIHELDLTTTNGAWADRSADLGERPDGSYLSSSIYDPLNKLFIAFAGTDINGERDRSLVCFDTTLTAETLHPFSISLLDKLRMRDAMAYAFNPDRGDVLMLGGFGQPKNPNDFLTGTHLQDVGIYNRATNKWTTNINGIATFPRREGAVAVYDTTGDRFLIFGGLSGGLTTSYRFNDVWEVKADANGDYSIRRMNPSGTLPSQRWLCAMVYDPTANRLVMFGGQTSGTTYVQDTWELDLTTGDGTWTDITPGGTKPSGRRQMSYIYDPGNHRMLIFGGNDASDTYLQELWEWNLTTDAWTNRTPGTTKPSGRRGMVAGYDGQFATKRMIMFGGYNGSVVNDEVWYCNVTTPGSESFTQITGQSPKPAARRSHIGVVDSVNNKFIVSHGRPETNPWYEDTWEMSLESSSASWTWRDLSPKHVLRASVQVSGLSSGDYHWQGWVTDNIGGDSLKVAFGDNAESQADFSISGGASKHITAKATIARNYTLTATAKARIQRALQTTLTAKARIQLANTKTLTAKANIKNTTAKTVSAKGRVLVGSNTKTIIAKASVRNTLTKTLQAKARIQTANITKTLTAKANLRNTIAKTVSAKARIQTADITKTITAKARLVQTFSKTIIAKASVKQLNVTKTLTAKANVRTTQTKTLTARASVKNLITRTVSAKARIALGALTKTTTAKADIKQANVTRTTTSKARIQYSDVTKTITAKARIQISNVTKTLSAKARIQHSRTSILYAKARIGLASSRLITAKADIKKIENRLASATARIALGGLAKSVNAKASIKQFSVTRTATAKARVQIANITKTLTSKARIQIANVTKTITAKARVTTTATKTISGKANIRATQTVSISAKSNIRVTQTKAISAKANIRNTVTKTISAKANIKNTQSKSLSAKARIGYGGVDYVADAKASIKQFSVTRTGIAKASIKQLVAKTAVAKARITATQPRLVSAKAAIKIANVTKTTTAKARILVANTKTLTAKADIKKFGNDKTISATARVQQSRANSVSAKANVRATITKTLSAKSNIRATQNKTITAKGRIKVGNVTKVISAKASIKQFNATRTLQGKASVKQLNVTKTLTSKARVQIASVKTITAKARVQIASSKTISAKSNVRATISKTLSAKARVQVGNTGKTVSAKASIKRFSVTRTVIAKASVQQLSVTKTSTAKARIQLNSSKSVSAKADIKKFSVERTVSANAVIRISGTGAQVTAKADIIKFGQTKTVTATARIQHPREKSITAKSRIQIIPVKTVTAKARVQKGGQFSISAKARINTIVSKTTTAKANIKATISKTVSAKSRIQIGNITKAITAKGSVKQLSVTKAVSAKASVEQLSVTKQISGKARITASATKTITAKARVQLARQTSVTAKARIQIASVKTVSSKANIRATVSRTFTSKARIGIGAVQQVISAKASIKKFAVTHTVIAKASVKQLNVTKTATAKARIQISTTRIVSAKARIQIASVKTLTAKANIKATQAKQVSAKSRVQVGGNNKTLSAKADIKQLSVTRTLTAKASIKKFNVTKTLTAKADIKKLAVTKTLSAKANIKPQWWMPTELTINSGVITSGTLVDARTPNGVNLVLGEVIGTPGFSYDFLFERVNPSDVFKYQLSLIGYYDGNLGHTIKVQQFNFTSQQWVDVTTNAKDIQDAVAPMHYSFHLLTPYTDYISNGQIKVRIVHSSPSNVNHHLIIDELRLEYFGVGIATAKADIRATLDKTATAKARVQIGNVTKSISAKARITTINIAKTVTAKGQIRITKTTTATSKARITTTETRLISAKANVKATITKTVSAKARVQIASSKTIIAKASVKQFNVTKVISAKARIQINPEKTISAKADIKKTTSQTVSGRARLGIGGRNIEMTAKARITRIGETKTVTSKARVQQSRANTLTAKARIRVAVAKTIIAKASIKKIAVTKAISAKASIKKFGNNKTLTAKASIKQLNISRALTAKARINLISGKTISAKANIKGTTARTISGRARIGVGGSTLSVSAKARIKKIAVTKTILAKARIQRSASKTLTAKARITVTATRTATAKATIAVPYQTSVSAKARIQYITSRVISAKALVTATATRRITAKASIAFAEGKTITAKARINLISQVTVSAKAWVRIVKILDIVDNFPYNVGIKVGHISKEHRIKIQNSSPSRVEVKSKQ